MLDFELNTPIAEKLIAIAVARAKGIEPGIVMTLPELIGDHGWHEHFIAGEKNIAGRVFKRLADVGRVPFEYVGDNSSHSALYKRN